MNRMAMVTAIALMLPAAAIAADPRRDAIIADFANQARKVAPGFTGFSAQRGEALFRAKWSTSSDPRATSCTACHTDNPKNPGQNAKTGRAIEPVAVSVNPKRFTDMAEVEKQFGRDCKNVIGRECTPLEKGDYVTFMSGQ
jgi:mono/diheme cytochrome c family protein